MGIWEYGRRLCPHRGGMRRAKGFSRRYFRRSSRRLPGGPRRVSGGFVCQLPDGFPHGVPWGYSRRFPAVFQGLAGRLLINCRWWAGGWRVHMRFPASFPAGFGWLSPTVSRRCSPWSSPRIFPEASGCFSGSCRASVVKFRMADWRMELPSERCAAGEAPLSDGGRQKLGCRGGMMEETDEI